MTLVPTDEATPAPTKPYETASPTPVSTTTPIPSPSPTVSPTPSPTPTPTQAPVLSGNVGDIITFGSYEQDNVSSNGKEPIEWIVLSNDGEKMLLLSKYALDCKQYNTEDTEITWENCTLRNWLNGSFYNTAFSEKEKLMIKKTIVVNDDNPESGTKGGNNTSDNIFLLSIDDMKKT